MSAAPDEPDADSRQTARVVVVDDAEDLRDLLCFALRRSPDFEVVGEAGNGREAIDVVGQVRPDIVLLDLAMPVMDGLEALPQLRRLVPTATILVFSGFSASTMAHKALDTGADGYLQKGMPVKQILNHLRTTTELTSTDRRPPTPPSSPSPPSPPSPPAPPSPRSSSGGPSGPAPSTRDTGPGDAPGTPWPGLPFQRSGLFDTAFDDTL